ncbi:hypothetical protein F2P81_023979 [Scophthalmus maximus]|uniref:Uncharacterized protein n=1 Tax=Scophthalmus maximus TaxID=52904 RepID=A0A6A4RSS9_SCOMX|nr:hypothetical protein F2P81_023979 [Scophthalmus maximus]
MTASECKVSEIKRDVSSNSMRMDEEIHETEKTLDTAEEALATAIKRIAYLESKAEDLENRGRIKNLWLYGLREGAEGQQTLFDFINSMLTQWLGLNPDRLFTLERVRRTLASGKPNQTRAVLIRFLVPGQGVCLS